MSYWMIGLLKASNSRVARCKESGSTVTKTCLMIVKVYLGSPIIDMICRGPEIFLEFFHVKSHRSGPCFDNIEVVYGSNCEMLVT